MFRTRQRRDQLRRLVRRHGFDAILVTGFANVTYLTGFTGDDSCLLLAGDDAIILSDLRYAQQLSEECPGLDLEIRRPGMPMRELIAKVVKRAKIGKLAVEAGSMTLGLFEQLRAALARVELVGVAGLVEQLREIKDREEIAELRRAVECAEQAFGAVRASLQPGRSEKEIADEMEHQVRLLGGRCCSFPTVVAAGRRAALPHGTPAADRWIGEQDFVLIDWGARRRLYVSDLTRVLIVGKISPKLERIHGVVLRAQQRAIASIRAGVTMHEVDAAARNVIAKAGFGKCFGHGVGHGIGLEIHEGPRLAANQHQPLRAGMVVTVEPGIYLPAWGGVRIEDDVLVTRTGHEVLTSVPKDLADCVVA